MERYTLYQDDVFAGLDKVATGSVDLCIVDPPYCALAAGRVAREENKNYPEYEWDKFPSISAFSAFTEKWFALLKTKMKDNSYIFIFWSQKHMSLGHQIFKPDRTLIWQYSNLVFKPKGDWQYTYEPIFVIKKGRPQLALTSPSVLSFTKPQANYVTDRAVYPTQKPRALIAHLLRTVGLPKDSLVLDCFQGSGVVGEQSLLAGYKYIGIDKDDNSMAVSKVLLDAASKVRTLLD